LALIEESDALFERVVRGLLAWAEDGAEEDGLKEEEEFPEGVGCGFMRWSVFGMAGVESGGSS